ncbi:hypothetical protein [Flavobacterium sp. ACN6]|uniref:hypothetical protein n=1 Tax=Flavobacterium sp. ACN6 TaxID=1920426 RepID=UPI001554A243|nr:hypothetical protein [Flavobacterium sp. ACN6]PBJ12828.1 hypothetical protein BSF42_20090 [Flavobacterium sp. ACN6]
MNKYLFIIVTLLFFSCNNSKNKSETTTVETLNSPEEVSENNVSETEIRKSLEDFIPKNYVAFDTIYGDLNKDNLEDCILIIKGTDKSKFIKDDYRGELDRNRRGIIVLFSTNNSYELAVKNYECFSSENEDGGVYFAPELSVEIEKGNLKVHYGHGRYGYWSYTFRNQNNDFELIGYDSSNNRGPVVESDVSINFLTRTKITNENTNKDDEGGDEIFEKTVTKINKSKLLKLSEIKDFDQLEVLE